MVSKIMPSSGLWDEIDGRSPTVVGMCVIGIGLIVGEDSGRVVSWL